MYVITAQTIQQIVTQIYDSPLIWDYLNYLDSRKKEDMMGEMILQLMNHKAKTIDRYKNGILIYYLFSAFKIMKYPTSSFYKKFTTLDELGANHEVAYENNDIENKQKIEDFINECKNNCFKRTDSKKRQQVLKLIYNLYFEMGLSLRKIERCTGINHRQVWQYTNEIKNNIKEQTQYDKSNNSFLFN